jgi:hypothetical protein
MVSLTRLISILYVHCLSFYHSGESADYDLTTLISNDTGATEKIF